MLGAGHGARTKGDNDMKARTVGAVLAAFSGLLGCATSFTGDAHVEGGPSGCKTKCQDWGMDFAGMVAMGEYSDACICHVRGKEASATPSEDLAAVAGGATGVILQMRRRAREQGQSMMMH